VSHSLPDLDQALPRSLSERRLALEALLIPHHERHKERLLQYGTAHRDLSLDREPNLQSHGVGLGPNPRGVHQPNLSPGIVLAPFF